MRGDGKRYMKGIRELFLTKDIVGQNIIGIKTFGYKERGFL